MYNYIFLLLFLMGSNVIGFQDGDRVDTTDTISSSKIEQKKFSETKPDEHSANETLNEVEIRPDSPSDNNAYVGRPWYDYLLTVLTILVLSVTAYSSWSSIRDNRKFKENEAKHKYYTTIILDPVIKETSNFISTARRALKNVGLKDKEKLYETLLSVHSSFYEEINMSFEGWDDKNLRTDVMNIVLGIEDIIMEKIYGEHELEDTQSVLVQLVKAEGEIYKRLMQADPIM